MKPQIWRNFDFILLLVILLLIGFGLAMNYSTALTTVPTGTPFLNHPTVKQGLYAVVGLVFMSLAIYVDYRVFRHFAPFLYVATMLFLVAVVVIGSATHGSRRWVDLGPLPVQPSELAKLVLTIALAAFLAAREDKMKRLATLIGSVAIVAVPVFLVYLQPDLGTIIIFACVWLGVALMSGMRISYFAGLGVAGALAIPFVYEKVLHGYMRDRLDTFLDPGSDPLGAGYNVLQSEISVGSGGLWGKGFAQGTQSQLHFLRVQNTDFVFSVVGEELGFVGALVLFFLFIVLLFRCVRAASRSQDTFGRFLAVGIAVQLLFQVFVNIGVNTRVLPVTGIPLPFISSGGSSLITILLSLGIVQSIVLRHKRLEF
ncbi:MAG: rod shape-determining protein RodA [Dehalococcoidia bacterium]|nr:rod shape-determining protein RodA [Dehalococcoidia bacterium]